MSIKEIVENFKVEDYFYIALPEKKICVELTDYDKAIAYSKAFGGVMYNHYPYAEYGYEDPYAFTNEWTILTNYGDRVTYDVDESGTVQEVLTHESF